MLYSNSALENFSHDYIAKRKNCPEERDTEHVANSDEDGDMDGPVEVESKVGPGSANAGCDQINLYFLAGFGM
jgi:hypothetical protein